MIPELLESRIAPAGVVTFTDVDGDLVTVKSSKGTTQQLKDALTFSSLLDVPRQLQSINLEQPTFIGTNLTITSTKAGGGDGHVNVGQIRLGGGQAYGTFSIDGDLATMGGGGSTGVVKKVSVLSLGLLGNSTVPGGLGTPFLQVGVLDTLEVKGSVASDVEISGDLKLLKIGGHILGTGDDQVGSISIGGRLITGTVAGLLLGAAGDDTGSIIAGSIGSLTVGGLEAAGGDRSGAVFAETGGIDKLVIKGDVAGGTATLNAQQIVGGFIKSLQIDGSVFGGSGAYSTDLTQPGQIFARDGFGAILIKGDVLGGNSDFSGTIAAGIDANATTNGFYSENAPVGKVTINGSLIGGGGDFSGSLFGEGSENVKIGRDLMGGSGDESGVLNVEDAPLGNIVIVGSIIGGSGIESGKLIAETEEGPRRTITVGGSVIGGIGTGSGGLEVNEDGFSKITVGGTITGGVGNNSGIVDVSTESGSSFAVKIGGSVRGGSGNDSGGLLVDGDGSGTLTVNGSIEFGSGQRSGFLRIDEMKSVLITGSVLGGFNNSGQIRTEEVIGSLTINGSLIGVQSTARILAMPDTFVGPAPANAGQTINKLVIKGDVHNAEILAGYELVAGVVTAKTADASLGIVEIGGDWVTSNLVAGVDANGGGFGNANDIMIAASNDPALIARIASVTIGGIVLGIPGGSDSFGFVAQQIDAFKFAGIKLPTRAANALDPVVVIGPTLDVSVRELA